MEHKAVTEKIEKIYKKALEELDAASDAGSLENWKTKYLGRKSEINGLFSVFAKLSVDGKREAGARLNDVKNELNRLYETSKEKGKKKQGPKVNLSFPGRSPETGCLHPVTVVTREMTDIFAKMGFGIVTGPEIETDYYNFTALNIPSEHPAKDVWDTFYISEKEKVLLRTHTSPVQVRIMEKVKPPLRVVAVGKCFRRDDVDSTHSPVFHQMEGLMVDEGINFAHLKGILTHFITQMFGDNVKVKFTPSFFPFTEPSAEVSMSCNICRGKGCSTCHNNGYIEVLGCGMVHPQVFRNVGYDADRFTGFAFGMGIERLAIIKFGITDIRYFYQNDLRFIRQFP